MERLKNILKNIKINNIVTYIKKHKYISLVVLLVIIIIIFLICFNINKNKEPIPLDEVMNIENYNKLSIKKSKRTISKKYNLKRYRIYETKDDVELNNQIGKMLFIRSKNFNANIFQTRTKIEITSEDMPTLMKIEQNMERLRIGMLSYLRLDNNTKPIKEEFTGKQKYSFPMPIRESVYIEKREYNATYIGMDNKEYDLNYYMIDDYLICELVYILNKKSEE